MFCDFVSAGMYHSASICETPRSGLRIADLLIPRILLLLCRLLPETSHNYQSAIRNPQSAIRRSSIILCYHSGRDEDSRLALPGASPPSIFLADRLRRRRHGDVVFVRRQLPAGRRATLLVRALGVGSSRIVRRRLVAPALHFRLRLSGFDRLPRRADVDSLDLPGGLVSDLAAGRGFKDRPRAAGHCARLVATVLLPFLRRQYDRADLRAGIRRRAAVASSRAPQGWNDRGFADDPGAARRIFPRHVAGSLGIADCGLRIADCGYLNRPKGPSRRFMDSCQALVDANSAIRNPQSAIAIARDGCVRLVVGGVRH